MNVLLATAAAPVNGNGPCVDVLDASEVLITVAANSTPVTISFVVHLSDGATKTTYVPELAAGVTTTNATTFQVVLFVPRGRLQLITSATSGTAVVTASGPALGPATITHAQNNTDAANIPTPGYKYQRGGFSS